MSGRVVVMSVALLVGAGLAAPARSEPHARESSPSVREVGADLNGGRPLPLQLGSRDARRAARARVDLGDTKEWLALDNVARQLYLKRFELRGRSKRVEVWVAKDRDAVSKGLAFPSGDCRNDERTDVTDRQVRYLIREYRDNIYPKESAAFSRPPGRDGTDAVLPSLLGLTKRYYAGPARRLVILVDNVRDEHFYDADNSANSSYIAGFFSSQMMGLFDRNVLTLDGFDWRHRLRAAPPHEPVPGDVCNSKPARPYLYEGVLAHEYQHLLQHYRDSSETEWVNEGLSDWAQTVTGYVDARLPVTAIDFDAHLQAFYGWINVQTSANPNPTDGGPENSLTAWSDQGGGEILADYGAAYSFMVYLADRYGDAFLTALHREPSRGLSGVRAVLDGVAPGVDVSEVLHDWAAMVALDEVLDDGALLTGGSPLDYSSERLAGSVNWDSLDAYASAGAPPNGSDYVRLRDAEGEYFHASSLEDLAFDGGETLTPAPVEWTVDEDPPGRPDDAALYSGVGDDLDRAIVKEVSVPVDEPVLTFETSYDIDQGFDGAFVQISDDGGITYRSLSNEHTTNDFPPGGSPAGREAPGLTGSSNGWTTMSFDLSEYAGQDVLLAFRYITDSSIARSGWWIDEVDVGIDTVSQGDELTSWMTPSEARPEPVSGFTVQLIAYDDARERAWAYELELDSEFDASLTAEDLAPVIGDSAQTVAAIVTYDEPTETIEQYAPYTLTVNGTEQPGG
ncbi:MAG TPA: peptidase M6 [Actinomycetota bacterium]